MRINSILSQPHRIQNPAFTSNKDSQIAQDNKETNKKASIAPAVTIATIASVVAVTMMLKGFQQFTQKNFKRLKMSLEERIDYSSYKNNKEKTRLYEYALRRINSAIQKSESINNITTYKDVLFMKLMYQTKLSKQIHDSISRFFEKISRKTVIDTYSNVKKDFEKMNQIYNMLDKEILKDSPDKKITHKGESTL